MTQGNVRNSRQFRELAGMLREQLELHGVAPVAGEAEELLGQQLSAVANRLRVTERTALASYLSESFVTTLAKTIASQATAYRETIGDADPVGMEIAEAGRVVAALGMALKLAVSHVQHTQTGSLAVITDGTDAIVRPGAEIRAIQHPVPIEFGGHDLVLARSVLVRTIELLRSGQWHCGCGPHADWPACGLIQDLTSDLGLVGGWVPAESPGSGAES